jgi:glycine oxidase
MEAGRADARPDPAALAQTLRTAARLFPGLEAAPFDVAAGVRAASPDGLPLVGFSRTPKVIVAAGARRNGWLLAPLIARMVAACATGGDMGPHTRRFAPARFEGAG